jgi:hypothetical protein
VRFVCCAFLQRSCEWILILHVANRPRPLADGSSASSCPSQTTLNGTSWNFLSFKSKNKHHIIATLYATDYSCWWMWLLFKSAQNFTDIDNLYPSFIRKLWCLRRYTYLVFYLYMDIWKIKWINEFSCLKKPGTALWDSLDKIMVYYT